MNVCPNCGNQTEDTARFCDKCGTPLTAAAAPVAVAVEPAPVAPEKSAADTAKELGGKVADTAKELGGKAAEAAGVLVKKLQASGLGDKLKAVPKKIWMIAGGALAALLILVILIGAFSAGGAECDYALYVNEDYQLSYTKLSGKGDPVQITEDGTSFSAAKMADDGKTLFYLDLDEDGKLCLFYRNAANAKKEPVLLESNVDGQFSITEDGSRVFFMKKGNLYVHNLKKSEKIESDVEGFILSEDGKKVLYMNDDGEVYIWNGRDSVEMDSDVEDIYYYSEDFKTIYYGKDDNLYLKSGSKDGEKLLSDCTGCYITEDGTGYAINDDGELYYVNGKKVTEIASDVTDRYTAYQRAVIVYEVDDDEWFVAVKGKSYELDVDDVNRVRLSSDGNSLHMLLDVDDGHGDLVQVSISSKPGKVKEVDSDVYTYDMGYANDSFYYFKEVEEGCGTFIYNGKEVDTEVYYAGYGFMDGKPFYVKDVDGNEATLYVNGKEITDEVAYESLRYNSEKGTLLFITGWDEEECTGILNAYKSKVQVIAEDVFFSDESYGSLEFFVMPQGEVLYFTDYDLEDGEGKLNCFNGSKSVEVADDAKYYIPIY